MSDDQQVSFEELNAFIDGELDAASSARVLAAIDADDRLRREACELRGLRDQVRNAYEPARFAAPPQRSRRLVPVLAVGLTLLLRLWFILEMRGTPFSTVSAQMVDAWYYHRWALEILDFVLFGSLDQFGIRPRSTAGIWGIAMSPFLHAGFGHLASNTLPFLALGGTVLLGGFKSLNVTIRKTLGLYANVRPCVAYAPVSPMR